MLKMFLSALASSTLVFSLVSAVPYTKHLFDKINSNFVSGLRDVHTFTRTVLGGAVLGAGMTLCGSCPGMVLIQIGTGTQNAAITMAGCLSGALLYGLIDSYIPKKPSTSDQYLYKRFNIPYMYLGLPFALALGGIVLATERYEPSTAAIPFITGTASIMTQKAWNPIASGVLLGLVQIPIIFVVGDTLGGSSAYCTVISKALSTTGLLSNQTFQYFRRFNKGLGNWWQVFYVAGAVGGGYLSASMSGSLGSVVGVSPLSAFTGGMCLLLGARLATGCTSGHGISGTGLLVVHSLIATASMFAGGIATALLFKHFL